MDEIERIAQMEAYMDEAAAALHDLAAALERYAAAEPKLRALEEYYRSGQWLRDYESDCAGHLPPTLKRGVLSQDGLYDLLGEAWEERRTNPCGGKQN